MARKTKKRVSRKRVVRRRRRALGSLGQTPPNKLSRSARDRETMANYVQEALDWKSDAVAFAVRHDCELAMNAHSSAKRTLGIIMSRSRSNAEKKTVQDLLREMELGQWAVTLCYQNQPKSRIRVLDIRTALPGDKL